MAGTSHRVVERAPEAGVNLSISNAVLEEIARFELARTEGVASTGGGEGHGAARRQAAPGVQVDVADRDVVFNLKFGVQAGARIPDVAGNVRQRIADAVHAKTGYVVRAVHVLVDYVAFEDAPAGQA